MGKEDFGNPSEQFMKDATPFKRACMSEDYARAAELLDNETMRWELSDMMTSEEMAYRAMLAAAKLDQPDLAEQAARIILNESNGYSNWQMEGAEGYLRKIGQFEEAPMSSEEISRIMTEAWNDKNFASLKEKLTDEQLSEALNAMLSEGEIYGVFAISKELGLTEKTRMAANILVGGNKFAYTPSARAEAQAFLDTLV